MIYELGQISNRDNQLLYVYRILRQPSNRLIEFLRYENPDIYVMDNCHSYNEGFEYTISVNPVPNRIPYLEFYSDDETELKHIESLREVELSGNVLSIRGDTDKLTSSTSVSIYWVPSLAYIRKIQDEIEERLGILSDRYDNDKNLIGSLGVGSGYVMNLKGVVPNLVNIGSDSTGLIYDDSHYRLSGPLSAQLLVNPPQRLISSLLKVHTGVLQIRDNENKAKVYQGFSGGRIELSGSFTTLVLKDISSIVFLDNIKARNVIISNCPAVIFRKSLSNEGSGSNVDRLELRNSYVTLFQNVAVKSIWCYQRSTSVVKKGSIQAVGCVEAGSTLFIDEPENSKISNIMVPTLQGLFYSNKSIEKYPYLNEIFLAQKPITFQRGQVEDPVPPDQAEVHIYLNQSGGGGYNPTPGGGGSTYSPYTDWYWSGDSRTVQLINVTHTDGKGYGGQALNKLKEVKSEIEAGGKQHNIILWWGVNGLGSGAKSYADVYKEIANATEGQSKVFVGTVGHCPNGSGSGKVDGGAGQDLKTFNEEIEQFNVDLKAELEGVGNVVLLDVAAYIKELEESHGAAWLSSDNLHYLPDASQMIYDWVKSQITNIEPGVVPEAPTDTNAGIIWNWFRTANIPNVSDRPELIAGIIGNCQQESYAAIDVLGMSNGYYGPWCESNSGFVQYMNSNGFSFHPYSVNAALQADAIPYAFTWLTQYSSSFVDWLLKKINSVSSQTGEQGARAYAELFTVCVERCVGGSWSIQDPGVYKIMTDYYSGTVYQYQDLDTRRNNAANIYKKFMGV